MNLLPTHAAGSLRLIRRAKVQGQVVSAAIHPKYYHLTKQDVAEQGARCAPGGVVTEDEERVRAIGDSLDDGTLSLIDSDHVPHTLEDLERFMRDPWTGPFGSPKYEYVLSLVLTDVHDGMLSLETAIRRLAENRPSSPDWRLPTQRSPTGRLCARRVLVDMKAEVIPIDEAPYTTVGWTPYRGRRLLGRPVLTMSCGEVIARDDRALGAPGSGRYLTGVPQR